MEARSPRRGDFDPERLAVYRLAREHTRAVRDLIAAARTRGFSDLVDQLRRSAASVTANVQEGYQEESRREKAHCYSIAKRSAAEAWGHADTMVDFELVDEARVQALHHLQDQILALLAVMIRNLRNER